MELHHFTAFAKMPAGSTVALALSSALLHPASPLSAASHRNAGYTLQPAGLADACSQAAGDLQATCFTFQCYCYGRMPPSFQKP